MIDALRLAVLRCWRSARTTSSVAMQSSFVAHVGPQRTTSRGPWHTWSQVASSPLLGSSSFSAPSSSSSDFGLLSSPGAQDIAPARTCAWWYVMAADNM